MKKTESSSHAIKRLHHATITANGKTHCAANNNMNSDFYKG